MTPCTPVVDPALVKAWLSARSIVRGLPQPVCDSGGWRVDTASTEEARRYVFAQPVHGLRRLAETVRIPRVFLKLCGSEDMMRALLPLNWQTQAGSFMMVCGSCTGPDLRLPTGYQGEIQEKGPIIAARICTADGATAAAGYAVQGQQVFIYDRIVTEVAYRRQGLATALMALLSSRRRSNASQQVLVATPQGRHLYEKLGWKIYSPYTTASLPS